MGKRIGMAAAVAIVALAATVAIGGSSQAAQHSSKKVYFADLFGGATPRPSKIFFTANSGPRVTHMKWENWGSNKTVGTGRYYDNQAVPCPPMCHPKGPAKIVLKKPRRCKQPKWTDNPGEKLYMYTEGVLTHPDTDTGETTVHSDISDYATYCN